MSLSSYLAQVEAGIEAAEKNFPTYVDKARQGLALLKEVEPFISLVNPTAALVVNEVEQIAAPVIDATQQ